MYCTPEDLRGEGVTEAAIDDTELEKRIKAACDKIDLWTGLWFEPRDKTFFMNGRGGRLLFLDVPAIVLTSVTVDRENIPAADVRIIDDGYSLLLDKGWRNGICNIEVAGTFGFVVADAGSPNGYSPPSPIVEIAKRLTLREIVSLTDGEAQKEMRQAGRIISETTDGHSYTLASTKADTATLGTYGNWTGDSSIDGILAGYRPPVGIGCA
jgi:hypothetical protein